MVFDKRLYIFFSFFFSDKKCVKDKEDEEKTTALYRDQMTTIY